MVVVRTRVERAFKLALCVATAVIALATAKPAYATSFVLEDYNVTLRQADPGLVLWKQELLGDPYTFDLSVEGQKQTVSLFSVGTKETALNVDDLKPYGIDVDFSFSAPPPAFGGNTDGITGAAWLGQSFGYVIWDNPLLLEFGSYGLLGITLSNVTFGLPGASTVYATFQLVRADAGSTAVPEPSGGLLTLVGLAAVAAFRRRFASV